MIMHSIAMHYELDVGHVWLVDGKRAVSVAVVSNSELFIEVLEGHNFCDRSLIKLYFSVVFDGCFPVGFYVASVSLHSHGALAFPDLGDYVLVTK